MMAFSHFFTLASTVIILNKSAKPKKGTVEDSDMEKGGK